ncbi:MAG: peptidoglycan bridge formation glycyltransferase FemA/FemB family protein [bacterium]|nr:peptidoglycan bridge formation glycyltransferase FemA/FemB family protein [bacterium]
MLQEIKDQKKWNDLTQKNLPLSGGFLQSWDWGEFQKAAGATVLRLGNETEAVQMVEHRLPLGRRYWFLPRSNMIFGLREEMHARGAFFLRFEPLIETDVPDSVQKTIAISPPATLLLDLTTDEKGLLDAMHEKTRYNIRLSARKGVVVQKGTSDDFEEFWKLMEETAKRDKFRLHPKSYYQKMLEILNPESYKLQAKSCFVQLWLARFEGKLLAAGLWMYANGVVTYLHGASSSEQRSVMAPHALHWEVIRDAAQNGYAHYDFWGINLDPHSAWAGITRFKMGFGGRVVEFPGTFDLPVSTFWYSVYKFARKVRRG